MSSHLAWSKRLVLTMLKNSSTLTDSQGPPNSRNRWPTVLKVLLSLGLLALLLVFVDLREAASILARTDLRFVAAALCVLWLDRALMAYKWSPLLHVVGVRVPFLSLYRIYSVAPAIGTLVPIPATQDLFRVFELSKLKVSAKAAITSIIMERVIGLIALLVVVWISLVLAAYWVADISTRLEGLNWLVILGTSMAVAVASIVFLISLWVKWPGPLLARIAAIPLAGKIFQRLSLIREYRNHPKTFLLVSVLTLIEQAAPIVIIYLVFRALDTQVPFLSLVAIVPIVVLVGRLPLALDGIGVQEGLYVGLLALVGVSASEAIVMSALSRVLIIIAGLPWLSLYFFQERRVPKPLPQIDLTAPK